MVERGANDLCARKGVEKERSFSLFVLSTETKAFILISNFVFKGKKKEISN